jgi:putative ABC transport system ATP-binding protein
MSSESLVELHRVTKSFAQPIGSPFVAIAEVDLQVALGEMVALVGRSGSGKSTLINIIAGLDRPTTGRVNVAGKALEGLNEDALASWRGRMVGVVFQFFQLLPTLTALENVLLAMDLLGAVPPRERRYRALGLLERVGLGLQADKLPGALSGGEQQRAALARALANDPPLLVADEPTGNLDSQNAASVLELFQELVLGGKTLVVATHDSQLARSAHRIVRLADGEVVQDEAVTQGETL